MQLADKQKQLLTLLADGNFHSGTTLATALGVSRSAVWKTIAGLSELGLNLIAVRGRGYRLSRPLELLTPNAIIAALDASIKPLVSDIVIHDTIDSTNNYLSQRARQNAPSGLVCLAEYQTAGKGRRGRQWVSPFGSNIYLSILWRFSQSAAVISGLSLAIGVAVIRALHQHFAASQLSVGLKWPNDIISDGKKLGGILIEVSGEADGPCTAIIGLGLNLYLSNSAATNINQEWTDLSKINNQPSLRNALVADLLNQLLPVLANFESVGIVSYLDEWRSYDALQGKAATVFIAEHAFAGVVQGIDDNGLLLMKLANGSVRAFASGEVSFSQ